MTLGTPGAHLEPKWAQGQKKKDFLRIPPSPPSPKLEPFWHIFIFLGVFFLSLFRDHFLTGSGIHFGRFLDDFVMIFGVFFFVFFLGFFCVNAIMENCVWTAQAWTDCMCGLPEGHLFSCFFIDF